MCGIAGLLAAGPVAHDTLREVVAAMGGTLRHRGPDGDGLWCDADAAIALAHRRLAIVELSPLGAQPMLSHGGRYVVTFNGEIYDFRERRGELERLGHVFRSESDTEVLLAAIEQWGVQGALERCRGMFAFAVWDRRDRLLHLARDRFGEKPLYYGELNELRHRGIARSVVFASELKALRAHPACRPEVDRDALALLLRHDYIPAPHCILRGIRKLEPGCILTVRSTASGFVTTQARYWHPAVSRSDTAQVDDAGAASCVERVGLALDAAVAEQMIADVPVGAFLSGGIDSSLVVASMQKSSRRRVRSFSIGFDEAQYDESRHARAVAERLGTEHLEFRVTSRDALDVVPKLSDVYDEPFADASQIPTYLVCALARKEVTVALSGDAADELFGGYVNYHYGPQLWSRLQRAPAAVRAGASQILRSAPSWALELATSPAKLTRRFRGRRDLAEHVRERASLWGSDSMPRLYHGLISFWKDPQDVVLGAREPATTASASDRWPRGADALAHMMFVDICQYLPDDILVKVDRAAMAVSLETRVPMLDPRVAESAWNTPTRVHSRDGRGKWVLRELLSRYLPRELFERPKQGFAVPLGRWLRGELRPWAEDLLAPERLRREGYFEPSRIRRRWEQHLAGHADWSAHLWSVLAFQAWLEDWRLDDVTGQLTGDGARRAGLAA